MRKRFILVTILALVVIVGGVGIGLAWETDYLDKWLPQAVKEWLGKVEKPAEDTGEEAEEGPKPESLSISNVKISNATATSFTVTWKTNKPASSRVEYGETSSYGYYWYGKKLVTKHSLTPTTGFAECTTYHYQVISKDAKGNEAKSKDSTFTAACPEEDPTKDWETFENESFGISFRYPKTYQLTKDKVIEAGKIGCQLYLDDDSRPGGPHIHFFFNPEGFGFSGICINTVGYKTAIEDGKVKILSRGFSPSAEEADDPKCEVGISRVILFEIGHPAYDELNKPNNIKGNGIIVTMEFKEAGADYEPELNQLIGTIRITKEEIYGK